MSTHVLNSVHSILDIKRTLYQQIVNMNTVQVYDRVCKFKRKWNDFHTTNLSHLYA